MVVPLESTSDLSIDIEFGTSYPPLFGVELKNSDFSNEKLQKGKVLWHLVAVCESLMIRPRLMATINESMVKFIKQRGKTFWQVSKNVNDVTKSTAFLPCIFIRRPESIAALLQ